MDKAHFDEISKLFAQRRLTRRRALRQGAAGLAAAGLAAAGLKVAAAQDSTPEANASPAAGGEADSAIEFLFLQSFESGTIAPKTDTEGMFTVTLQHGLGQTLYFSDRPDRIVGATPTPKFLDGLGFTPDNPPNAALLVDSGDGGVNIAVVELTNPSYDEASFTATYDISVLQDYNREGDMQLQEAPADLAALASSFGSAHLFIDDCPDATAKCYLGFTEVGVAGIAGTCWSWSAWTCHFCDQNAVNDLCNETIAACEKQCKALPYVV